MRSSGFVLAALVATTALAHADAKSLYAEGQDAYKKQNFALAAEKFVAAYEADPDPVYLFNAAQAYRFGNDCVKSADYYARFFAKVPNPPNAEKIHAWADEQTKCARDKQPATPVTPPPPPSTTTTTTSTPTTPTHAEPPPDPDSHSRTPGLVAVGVGGAAIITGIVFSIGWHRAQLDSDAICPASSCTWDPSYNDRITKDRSNAKRDSGIAYAGFSVGAILVAAGTYLLFSAGDHDRDRVTVAPTANGATVSTMFRF